MACSFFLDEIRLYATSKIFKYLCKDIWYMIYEFFFIISSSYKMLCIQYLPYFHRCCSFHSLKIRKRCVNLTKNAKQRINLENINFSRKQNGAKQRTLYVYIQWRWQWIFHSFRQFFIPTILMKWKWKCWTKFAFPFNQFPFSFFMLCVIVEVCAN